MTREQVLPGPAAAAVGERLLGRVEELATELTALIRRAEPFYDKDNLVSADDLRGSVRDNLTYILCRLAGRPTPGLDAARATGRRRAEQGAPLPAILHSYRVAGTAIWATILDDGLAHGADTAALLLAASELWSIMDELSPASTACVRQHVCLDWTDAAGAGAGPRPAAPAPTGDHSPVAATRAGRSTLAPYAERLARGVDELIHQG